MHISNMRVHSGNGVGEGGKVGKGEGGIRGNFFILEIENIKWKIFCRMDQSNVVARKKSNIGDFRKYFTLKIWGREV